LSKIKVLSAHENIGLPGSWSLGQSVGESFVIAFFIISSSRPDSYREYRSGLAIGFEICLTDFTPACRQAGMDTDFWKIHFRENRRGHPIPGMSSTPYNASLITHNTL